jgi:hypothetical protein
MNDSNTQESSRTVPRRMHVLWDQSEPEATRPPPQRNKRARGSQSLLPTTLNPLKWHAVFQTMVLVIGSLVLLAYLLLTAVQRHRLVEGDIGMRSKLADAKTETTSITFHEMAGTESQSTNSGLHDDHVPTKPVRVSLLPIVAGTVFGGMIQIAKVSTVQEDNERVEKSRMRFPMTVQLNAENRLETYSDPTASSVQPSICRVFSGCFQRDGKLIMHSSLQKHVEDLRRCGIVDVEFSEKEPTLSEGAVRKDLDFFTGTLRSHMPHLASDLLSFSHALSALSGAYGFTRRPPERSRSLAPMTLTHDRVHTMAADSWTNIALQMLPLQTRVETMHSLFSKNETSAVCFRSIVGYQQQVYWQVSPLRFGPTNHFFSQNHLRTGLDRSVLRPTHVGDRCAPRITVLNRFPEEYRHIENIDEIERLFRESLKRKENRHLSESSFQVRYMNISFREQVRTLQRADVILAGHGAALGNLIFCRMFTPLIEVFPFSKWTTLANELIF